MRLVWLKHPAFFRRSYRLLLTFRYSRRAEVTHRLILRVIDGAARGGAEEPETTDGHGGNPERRDPRASAENFASRF